MGVQPRATVLITGCSEGGIGHAFASRFQQEGLIVFASARTISKIGDLATLPQVTVVALDVTNDDSIRAAVAVVETVTGGRLNYLVNNAGLYSTMPLLDVQLEDARRLFDANVWGALKVTQAFAPLLIRAKGTVVNISSIGSCMPVPWAGVYAMSKAALNMLGRTLRLELLPFDVKVLTVITGAVDTHIFDNGPEVTLPEDSPYHPFLENIERRANMKGDETVMPFWMPADRYATKVVNDVIHQGKTGLTWRGASASVVRFVTSYLWTGLIDRYLAYKSGIRDSIALS